MSAIEEAFESFEGEREELRTEILKIIALWPKHQGINWAPIDELRLLEIIRDSVEADRLSLNVALPR